MDLVEQIARIKRDAELHASMGIQGQPAIVATTKANVEGIWKALGVLAAAIEKRD